MRHQKSGYRQRDSWSNSFPSVFQIDANVDGDRFLPIFGMVDLAFEMKILPFAAVDMRVERLVVNDEDDLILFSDRMFHHFANAIEAM